MNNQVHRITLQCTSVCRSRAGEEKWRRNCKGWLDLLDTCEIWGDHLYTEQPPPLSSFFHLFALETLNIGIKSIWNFQIGSSLKVLNKMSQVVIMKKIGEAVGEKWSRFWDSGTLGHQTVTSWEFSFLPPLSFSSRTSVIIITITNKMMATM